MVLNGKRASANIVSRSVARDMSRQLFLSRVYGNAGGDKQCRKIEYKPVYFGTFVVTREDVQQYMSHHPQYTKANRFKDIVLKVYI